MIGCDERTVSPLNPRISFSILMLINYAVKALVEIAAQVGKKGWNFKVDPCSNESSWATPKSNSRPLYNNSLICNCSYPHGACHVVQLYAQLSFPLFLLILINNIVSLWVFGTLKWKFNQLSKLDSSSHKTIHVYF